MSILSTAYSGLNAFQKALDITGNNIANATTKGYSRQTLQLTPGITQQYGSSYIGRGVQIASVTRNTDQFANLQVRNSNSVKSQYDTFYQQASQIDSLLSQNGVSLSTSMQSFFNALTQLNNTPNDSSSRTAVLKQSQLMASQFQSLQNQLDQYQSDSTAQITSGVKQLNFLAKSVAAMNQQIMAAPGDPALLDQRDSLLQQLSQYADLNVISQPNGTVNVGFGSGGDMLVTGTDQRDLTVSSNQTTAGSQIMLNGTDVSSRFTSGSIRGQLDFEQNILGKASQLIGQMAIGLAQKFNAQQALGVDMNNSLGKNYFTDYNSTYLQQARSISSSTNTGTASLQISISDISQTQLSDYNLTVVDASAHQYSLVRKSDGAIIPLTWDSSSSPAPATLSVTSTGDKAIDGMTITVDDISHLANKDQFTLSPTRGAASNLNVLVSDFRDIALAAPVSTSAAATNKGQGAIAFGTVFNSSAVANNYAITIDASDPTKYTISPDTTQYTLVPGSDNTIYLPPGSSSSNASYSVVLSGNPSAGDVFNLGFNSGAVGDNRNGLQLASVFQNKIFTGGTENLTDKYADLLSNVGTDTNQAKLRSSSADIVYQQAVDFQSSASGVNLDEEAANLIKFQQAYQAAGKLMQVANDMMSVLFSMFN